MGNELILLQSCLSGGNQMVVQGQDKSRFQQVKVKVSQSSILGPLLFIFAVNDLASSHDPCSTVLYADDTTWLNSIKDLKPLVK